MRYLVTGATGHIGSHLVKHLVDRKAEVAILVRPESNNFWRINDTGSNLVVIHGDLNNTDELQREIEQFAPDTIFHLAWNGVAKTFKEDPSQIIQNLTGSIRLLEIARASGCKAWVGLGSQAEYGVYNKILREEMLPAPETAYGVAKLCTGIAGQKLCEIYNMQFAWLRLTAAYGPMDDKNHLIPYVILKLLEGQVPKLTQGQQEWDYLYVDDIVDALYTIAGNKEVNGIFNLGSGKTHTVRSIVEKIRDLINPDLSLTFGEIPYSQDQIMKLQVDISRLNKATGWQPATGLEDGLQKTVEWFQANRQYYE